MYSISKSIKICLTSVLPILLFLLTANVDVNAQRLTKYENVYKEAMATDNKNYAYTLFSEFLAQNKDTKRANLFFQMGILANDLSLAFDPIAQYNDYSVYTNAADLYLKRCMQYLNDAEASRDNILFQGISTDNKKLALSEIYDYTDSIIKRNTQQMRDVKKIHNAYIGLTRNYTKCQDLYKNLCDEFITVKEMYLGLSSEIFGKMEDMQDITDSIEYYLNEYSLLINEYPVKGYNVPEAIIEKINIFRVDGLSMADFTAPKTVIWDYRAFSEKFISDVDAFAFIYQDVINANNQLTRRINTFNSNRTLSDNYVGYEVDSELVDSLNNIAYFPTLNRLISYKQEKLNFLTQSRRKINSANYDNNGKLNLKDKLYYYDKLQHEYNTVDYKLKDLESFAKSGGTTNYSAMNFSSHDDFVEYLDGEKLENGVELNAAFSNLQNYHIKSANNIRRTNNVSYRKQQIPLYLGNGFYRSSHPQNYITKCIESTNNGVYLAGAFVSREGFATAYIAMCTADTSSVTWLKTVDIGRVMYDNCATALYPTFDGGCFVLVVAKNVSDPDLMSNTIIQYNSKGVEVKRLSLPEQSLGIGRSIRYDDVNEHLLVSFYGKEELWYQPNSKLVIQKVNLENNILMNAAINLDGSIVEIFSTKDNGILVLGNYFSLTDEKGTEHKLVIKEIALQSGIFSALFSPDGNLLKVNRYPIDGGTGYAMDAIKITNNSINIIGQKGLAQKNNAVPLTSGELIYMSIDAEGGLLHTNQKQSD